MATPPFDGGSIFRRDWFCLTFYSRHVKYIHHFIIVVNRGISIADDKRKRKKGKERKEKKIKK
jgi:hypothetical protein